MIKNERLDNIIKILEKENYSSVNHLAGLLYVDLRAQRTGQYLLRRRIVSDNRFQSRHAVGNEKTLQ